MTRENRRQGGRKDRAGSGRNAGRSSGRREGRHGAGHGGPGRPHPTGWAAARSARKPREDDGATGPHGLARWLSKLGLMSRTRAEEAVRAGRVTLRGKVVMDPERRCLPGRDDIRVDGRPVRAARKLYFVLHKPVGCITTASDPEGRPTAYDYVPETRENLQAVGRLDADSSGLLLFTNDTEFAARITQAGGIEKVYRARVRGRVEPPTARRFESGIEIEGALTLPARCSILEATEGSTLVEVTIREGRNRQIRKMWEALGHPVLELHRTRIGPIVLGSLPPGRARALSEAERALLEALARPER